MLTTEDDTTTTYEVEVNNNELEDDEMFMDDTMTLDHYFNIQEDK